MTVKTAFPVLDGLHLGMMLAALGLAYYLPFELLLLSYAILGPAHYMTEISWLHERSYFMSHRYLAWFLVVCTICLLVVQPYWAIGLIFWIALTFSAAFALFQNVWARVAAISVGVITGFLIVLIEPLNTPLAILLPTVIHVSAFTFFFMLG